jgi:hypothetical protein
MRMKLKNVATSQVVDAIDIDFPGDNTMVFVGEIVPDWDPQISVVNEAECDDGPTGPLPGWHISNDYGKWQIMEVAE